MAHDIVSLIPGFCEAFTGNGNIEGGFIRWSTGGQAAFDYSVESLAEVDCFLDAVRPVKNEIEWQVYTNTVLATGAYIGEVLRRRGDKRWEWMNYDDFMRAHANLAAAMGIGAEDLNVAAVLVAGKSVTLPFNKVMRNLEEGAENSIHFYVTAMGAGD
jgi:hypothetical protein